MMCEFPCLFRRVCFWFSLGRVATSDVASDYDITPYSVCEAMKYKEDNIKPITLNMYLCACALLVLVNSVSYSLHTEIPGIFGNTVK